MTSKPAILTRKAMINRWLTPEGARQAKEIVTAIYRSKPLERFNFLQRHQGRWDLRGLTVGDGDGPVTFDGKSYEVGDHIVRLATGGLRFRRVAVKDIDFSYATLSPTEWEECSWTNVLAESANVAQLRAWACLFQQVSFKNANLTECAMGGGGVREKHNTFRNVDFSNTKLRGTAHSFEVYEDCDFSHANLHQVNFDGARFYRCKFAGLMDDVAFRLHALHAPLPLFPWQKELDTSKFSNPMQDVDFSDAILQFVKFTGGVDLSRCIFPHDGSVLVIRHAWRVFLKVRERVDAEWTGKEKEIALRFIDMLHLTDSKKRQPIQTFEKLTIAKQFPEWGTAMIKIIEDEMAAIRD